MADILERERTYYENNIGEIFWNESGYEYDYSIFFFINKGLIGSRVKEQGLWYQTIFDFESYICPYPFYDLGYIH